MYALIVNIDVKPEFVEEFMAVTLENARGTRTEPGNLRFDVLRGTVIRISFSCTKSITTRMHWLPIDNTSL